MKFRRSSQKERDVKKKDWHLWFAWYPISVGEHDYRWFEMVERKGVFLAGLEINNWSWQYRM